MLENNETQNNQTVIEKIIESYDTKLKDKTLEIEKLNEEEFQICIITEEILAMIFLFRANGL